MSSWGRSWGNSWSYSWGPIVTLEGIKFFNGSSWVVKPMKVFMSGAWRTKQIKRWNGTQWVVIQNAE